MASQVLNPDRNAFFKAPREFPKRLQNGFPVGKRTRRRNSENGKLRRLKLERCEIRIPGICVDRIMLSWAHAKKSRFLLTSKDWQEAARCCLPCHQHIEALTHKKMHAIVTAAIKRRKL